MKRISVLVLVLAALTAGVMAAAPAGASPPPGYRVVGSKYFTVPPGVQVRGQVTCPGLKVPSDGGVSSATADVSVAVNSSFPSGHSWIADVNNATSANAYFAVWAICQPQSTAYTVVVASSAVNPGATNSAAAQCPGKTRVVGGGALSYSLSTKVNINSTVPNDLGNGATAWRVAMANASTGTTDFDVYAVCRNKPKGYSIQFGAAVSAATGTSTTAGVSCPGSSIVIGGGGFTGYQATDSAIDLNSLDLQYLSAYPFALTIRENNGGSIARSLAAAAICAGT
jgi:hypothetical protein